MQLVCKYILKFYCVLVPEAILYWGSKDYFKIVGESIYPQDGLRAHLLFILLRLDGGDFTYNRHGNESRKNWMN